jgi:tetratricopeptide (TPR) repeat protein
VFICYRREVGGILAMALYQSLSERGVDAFYDIESIRAGQFDTAILGQIASRPYFVLVLTPGTLERCGDEGDWVRREIAHALTTERVIIPAYTPNFDFKDYERYLPRALGHEVARFNGQKLDQKWFKFAVQQLADEFLVPIELAGTQLSRADAAVVEQIQRQARAEPAVTTVELSAQTSFERAFTHHNNGELAGAIAAYSEAIRLNPAYAAAFYNRGIARGTAGGLRGAIADYDAAIRLDPEFAFAFHNRGIARGAAGDLRGAIADYDAGRPAVPTARPPPPAPAASRSAH